MRKRSVPHLRTCGKEPIYDIYYKYGSTGIGGPKQRTQVRCIGDILPNTAKKFGNERGMMRLQNNITVFTGDTQNNAQVQQAGQKAAGSREQGKNKTF